MLLTEKEAKEKWCPHVRIAVLAGQGAAACNEHPDPEIDLACRCVGSRCAMWRWADSPSLQKREFTRWEDREATAEPIRDTDIPAHWPFVPADATRMTHAHWVEPLDEAIARRRGYCGLAGKPEER